MNNNLITMSNVSMSYGKKRVINDINLSLSNNKVIGLCGPNGAGKTTLIKMIVGLLRDFDGEILIDKNKIGKITKSLVSYQADTITLESNLSGNKIIDLYEKLYQDFDRNKFIDLLTKFKVPLDQPIKKMSKGMKEKFQLALTLSRNAKVFIFDEPIAGVDPASRDSILETIINHYSQDALLIISTHLIQDIETILDEVIFIDDGKVILHQNCDDLREERNQSIDQIFREEFKW